MRTSSSVKKAFAAIFLAATLGAAVAGVAGSGAALRGAAAGAAVSRIRDVPKRARAVEAALTANFPEKDRLLELRSRIQALLGKNATDDFSLVKDVNGVLNHGSVVAVDTSRLHEYAARLYWLKRYAAEDGSRVLHLAPPDRVIKGYSRYEPGLPYRNLNPAQDSFLFYIGEYGVDYLDARSALAGSTLPPSEWVFRTGNGWTPQAAFVAFQSLIRTMEKTFNAELDPDGTYTDPENYLFTKVPQSFLGDLGKTVGEPFAGADAYTAIRPRFENRYAVEWIGADGVYGSAEGTAEQALLDPSALLFRDGEAFAPNDFYLSGVKKWVKIQNADHPLRPTLLLVHDRQCATLPPLLAPLFGEVHAILSEAGEYAVNIDQYLASNRFDYIVVALGPESYDDKGMDFFIGPKN